MTLVCASLRHAFVLAAVASLPLLAQIPAGDGRTGLATGKELAPAIPGSPQKTNSLPMGVAVSPDGRYLALLNAGFGTYESAYEQSIAVFDTQSGKLADFPDARTPQKAPQTLYQGIAFSADGRHLYASFESLTAPEGRQGGERRVEATGNAIAVYSFNHGLVRPERLIPIPLQQLAPGKRQNAINPKTPAGMAIPAPAGLVVIRGASGQEELLLADNLSDDALLLDPATGKTLRRFDLAGPGPVVPSTYPIAVTATRDGRRGFVALWNGSAIAELDLVRGEVTHRLPLMPPAQPTSPSSHPTAFAWSPDEATLYVALANRDAVAAVDTRRGGLKLAGFFDTRLPGQQYFGAEPNALAISPDGKWLFAANAGTDSVAAFQTASLRQHAVLAQSPAAGFIPSDWLPTGLAIDAGKLYIATGKGDGTGPNQAPQRPAVGDRIPRAHTYIPTLLHGSLAAVELESLPGRLTALTRAAVASNMQAAAQRHIAFHGGANPIRHVIYIIKENRTYDQVFGDLPAGNGDPSLTMYGEAITPNEHKLALQFGVLDNFFDSGEVSGDGHVWSTAGISSDYTEKTWQQDYRGSERMYDYEGVVENGLPLHENIPDVNEPASSYLWTNLARHGKTYYHFGEFVATHFCGEREPALAPSPRLGTPEPAQEACEHPAIRPGEPIPDNYGGGVNRYGWPIPLIAQDVATKPELQGHFDPAYPDFRLDFPDQLRVEEFLTHFRAWVAEREQGRDAMPQFVMLRLPNDHTAGTRPGMPTPEASVADNDLAVGRAVEAVSHSPYWSDTAFFILEDDAQSGADHVDAHRSLGLVISKYAPRGPKPLVDSSFYTTVSMLRTMEDLLGLPPMNNNDALAAPIAPVFAGAGDQPPFTADTRNRDNGLIYRANTPKSPGARESSRMDFRHEDRADPQKLNAILWREAMGAKPLPAMLRSPATRHTDEDE